MNDSIELRTKNPRGIYKEKARNRWRVRLYFRNYVYHLSYHSTFDEARETYELAKQHRQAQKGAPIVINKPTNVITQLKHFINPPPPNRSSITRRPREKNQRTARESQPQPN